MPYQVPLCEAFVARRYGNGASHFYLNCAVYGPMGMILATGLILELSGSVAKLAFDGYEARNSKMKGVETCFNAKTVAVSGNGQCPTIVLRHYQAEL